jgi:predicted transcriptional regulator
LEKASENGHVHRVAIAILLYLRAHPFAKDNLEGVSSWWVNENKVLVQKSLSLLVTQGVISEDRAMYSLSDELRNDVMGTRFDVLVRNLESFGDSRN